MSGRWQVRQARHAGQFVGWDVIRPDGTPAVMLGTGEAARLCALTIAHTAASRP